MHLKPEYAYDAVCHDIIAQIFNDQAHRSNRNAAGRMKSRLRATQIPRLKDSYDWLVENHPGLMEGISFNDVDNVTVVGWLGASSGFQGTNQAKWRLITASLPLGLQPVLAAEQVSRCRVHARLWVRSGNHRIAGEEERQGVDGIGDLQPAVIVGIHCVLAIRSGPAKEEVVQGND